MNRARIRLGGILVAVIALTASGPARAVDTGDILATDGWYGLLFSEHATGYVHRFGSSTPVADGLDGVVSDVSGNIYALLAYAGVVYRVDAETGVYTPVTSGGFLAYPNGICLLPGGDLLVSDGGPTGGVVRVDPSGGAQTKLYSGQVYAVTASAGGVVHVVLQDPNRMVNPACRLYQLDPVTGDTLRVSNTYIHCTCNLDTEANGNVLVTQPDEGSLKRIYPSAGGAVQLLASGGQLVSPNGVAVEDDGTIVVTDAHGLPGCNPAGGPETCTGLLFRIHPVTGAQTLLSQSSYWRLGGLGIYRGPQVITPTHGSTWGRIKTMYR